jgi:hypothetical protein
MIVALTGLGERPSAEWAVEAAKQQFAELEGIRDWKIHAGLIEIEPVDLERRTGDPVAYDNS